MALVQRGRQNQALVAAAGALVGRYGRLLGNEALAALEDAVIQGIEGGGQMVQQYLSDWIRHFGNELGNEAVDIARGVQRAVNDGMQQGGQLANAVQGTIREWTSTADGGGQLTAQDPTTLDDLIPQNSRDQTRARDRARIDSRNMEIDNGPEAVQLSAARAGGSSSNAPSKETPISNYPSISYGVSETHTTILPWTTWVTVATLDADTPVQLKLRLNAPVDIATHTIAASVNPLTKAIYNVPANDDGRPSGWAYPVAQTNDANERAQWWDYYAAMYDYYTVLGCEYEVRMYVPNTKRGCRAACAIQMDSYSSTSTSTGNIMPLTQYREVLHYKNINWVHLQPDNDGTGNNIKMYKGTYKPGMVKRNIINDGDVKTWTATATGGSYTLPNMNDILTLNFYRDSLAYPDSTGAPAGGVCVNMEITMKYIVQFKDLKQRLRYPNTVAGANGGTTITQTNSNLAEDIGSALAQWGASNPA